MATNTDKLKLPAQNYALAFTLLYSRAWSIMNVDEDGNDGAAPSGDEERAWPLVEYYDGISSIGTIAGSVANGGWSCELTIPSFPTNFDRYFGVQIDIQTWHANVPGVVGAAGTDPDGTTIFKGYQQTLTSERVFGRSESVFPIASSAEFLKRSQLRHGFDFAAETPHGLPGTAHDVVRHILLDHTNWADRSGYGLYFPNHNLDSFAVNEGSLWNVFHDLIRSFGVEPWVFCRRGDDLYLGVHPNLDLDGLHPSVNDPIIELDDDLVLQWNIERRREFEVATVTIVAQKSDQTEYVKTVGDDSGEGSHPKYQVRTDDTATVDALAAALLAHLNRRWVARPVLPLNVAVDLGDCVTVTTADPQRNIAWSGKKFVATEVRYTPVWQGKKRTWKTELVLDEVVV